MFIVANKQQQKNIDLVSITGRAAWWDMVNCWFNIIVFWPKLLHVLSERAAEELGVIFGWIVHRKGATKSEFYVYLDTLSAQSCTDHAVHDIVQTRE